MSQKISERPEVTTPQNADVFPISVNLATVPVTKKITLANLITAINKPAGSSGQVQFNSAGVFGGDNGLFWDNVNKRLGIGTTGPVSRLHVFKASAGTIITDGSSPVVIESNTHNFIQFKTPANSDTGLLFGTSASPEAGAIKYKVTTDAFTFHTAVTERVRIDTNGNVGIGTTTPTISDGVGLHLAGKILRIGTAKTPATAGAAGNAGEICWDGDSIYVCVAVNTWKKVAIAPW